MRGDGPCCEVRRDSSETQPAPCTCVTAQVARQGRCSVSHKHAAATFSRCTSCATSPCAPHRGKHACGLCSMWLWTCAPCLWCQGQSLDLRVSILWRLIAISAVCHIRGKAYLAERASQALHTLQHHRHHLLPAHIQVRYFTDCCFTKRQVPEGCNNAMQQGLTAAACTAPCGRLPAGAKGAGLCTLWPNQTTPDPSGPPAGCESLHLKRLSRQTLLTAMMGQVSMSWL